MLKCDPLRIRKSVRDGRTQHEIKLHEKNHQKIKTKMPNKSDTINAMHLPNMCPLCDDSFITINEQIDHLQTHVNDMPFECPDCALLYEDFAVFKQHIIEHDSVKTTTKNNDILTDNFCEDQKEESVDNFFEEESFHSARSKNEFENYNYVTAKEGLANVVIKSKNGRKLASVDWQHRDNKIREFQCRICNRLFTLASSLSLHTRRVHLDIKPHACKICDWRFAQTSDLSKHMRKHSGEKPFECDYCKIKFSQKRNLKTHMKMHTEQPSTCKYCGKTFLIDNSLKQHLKKHENGLTLEQCTVCQIPYNNQKDLETHIKRKHPKERATAKCQICNKSFKKSCDLQKHLRIHTGDRPYRCEYCDKTFSHATSLRNHRAGIHSTERPFQCSFCGKNFTFLGNLKVHQRSHTNERPYSCECGKSFVRKANLLEHVKIHTGIKSHKCEICNKSFTNSSTYFKHKKIHTNERNFQCHFCNKTFIQSAHLTKHIRTHTNEKPYACNICGLKSFRRSETLAKHMQTHNKNTNTKLVDSLDVYANPNNISGSVETVNVSFSGQCNNDGVITVTAAIPTLQSYSDSSQISEIAHILYTFPASDLTSLPTIQPDADVSHHDGDANDVTILQYSDSQCINENNYLLSQFP